jgi:hypothetical protein
MVGRPLDPPFQLVEVGIDSIQFDQVNSFQQGWRAVLADEFSGSQSVKHAYDALVLAPDRPNFEPDVRTLDGPWSQQYKQFLAGPYSLKNAFLEIVAILTSASSRKVEAPHSSMWLDTWRATHRSAAACEMNTV